MFASEPPMFSVSGSGLSPGIGGGFGTTLPAARSDFVIFALKPWSLLLWLPPPQPAAATTTATRGRRTSSWRCRARPGRSTGLTYSSWRPAPVGAGPPQAVSASAPATTSRISCVISAWRARFICSVSAVDQLAGVLRRVSHRGHPGALLGRGRLEQRPVELRLEVDREQPLEDLLGLRLEDEVAAQRVVLRRPRPRLRGASRGSAARPARRPAGRAPRRRRCRRARRGRPRRSV